MSPQSETCSAHPGANEVRETLRTPRRSRTFAVLGLFAGGLLLLQVGWMVAFPPFWGIDEPDHVFRASSVASGHWQPSLQPATDRTLARGEMMRVQADLVDSASGVCLAHDYSLPGNCTPMGPEHDGTVPIASAAGRYNPFYYLVAGTVAKPFPGNAALYAMRATTAIWSCLLLTGALWSLMTWARSRWPMVGLLLACTPTVLYSTAVAAPNGVHLAAAICLWCSMTGLFRPPVSGARIRRQFVALAAVALTSSVTTLFTHTLGLVWVPLIMLGAWGLAGRPPLGRFRGRGLFPWVGLGAASYLVAAAWVLLARTNDPTTVPVEHLLLSSSWWYVGRGVVLWPMQAIAAFPDKDGGAPTVVYAIWIAGVLACLIAGLRVLRSRARRAESATIALVVLFSFAMPTVLTLTTVHRIGGAWQGRYGYPVAVGFILGLAMLIDQAPHVPQRAQRALLVVVPGLFAVANVVSQVHVLHETSAIPGMLRVSSWDVPPVWLLVACGVASAAMLTVALRRQPRMLT